MASALHNTLKSQKGILFVKPAIVFRGAYSGRNIVAKNSEPNDVDERGYYPVERWIVSTTAAANEKTKHNEGLSSAIIIDEEKGKQEVLLVDLLAHDEKILMGNYSKKWPLTKILDIGGKPVKPNFGDGKEAEEEVPPIPAHVHKGKSSLISYPLGNIVNGKAIGQGKKEAYFLPPVDLEPYNANFGKVITRLGIKSSTKKEDFDKALNKFAVDDSVYALLNVFDIKPYDGWTIEPGVIHAPGPWLTFEIQLPQDDFNLAGWKLGQHISDETERKIVKESFCCRGLHDHHFISELVEWDMSTDPHFKEKYYRPSKVVEDGDWGRRIQIFFDGFYGEGFEVKAGKSFKRSADERPYGGVVWSGNGKINGNEINAMEDDKKEFLVTPGNEVIIEAGTHDLKLYVVFPLE